MSDRPSVGLIFDLDNTLVASQIDFAAMRAAVFDVLQEAGISVTDAQRRWPVGRLAELARGSDASDDSYERIWQLIEHDEVEGMKKATLEEGARRVTETLALRDIPWHLTARPGHPALLDSASLRSDGSFPGDFGPQTCCVSNPLRRAANGQRHLGKPERSFMIGDACWTAWPHRRRSWVRGCGGLSTGPILSRMNHIDRLRSRFERWQD